MEEKSDEMMVKDFYITFEKPLVSWAGLSIYLKDQPEAA
jgi:hypothetical protein